ncbi:beta-glucanase (GH16 family) [Marmoricola sp. OAE513]|uniref:glycoside hydrolase family 16 protein n=1 Tax=Marmoricola sp. OAE513 TaxID=2817894 RepID=UPI001AE63B24
MGTRIRIQARFTAAAAAGVLGTGLLTAAVTSPAESAVTATTGPSCGTVVITKADGSPWTCTFADEFTGTKLDTTKWVPQLTATSGFDQGGVCYTDSSTNLAVTQGALKLTLKRASWATTCKSTRGNFSTKYSSGMVSTYTKFTQAYGRFEIRAKFGTTKQPGHQSAFWLYPEVPGNIWPYSGEIDIAEWYSKYPDRVIPFLHYGGTYYDPYATNNNCKVANVGSAWHTYALEWTPQTIKFIYDDQVCLTNSTASGKDPFNKNYMVALTQLLGTGVNAPNVFTPSTGSMTVDYVRVWA